MAYQFTCTAEDCAFQIRSEDRDEVIDYVQEHADEMHSLDMARSDVRDGISQVDIAADD